MICNCALFGAGKKTWRVPCLERRFESGCNCETFKVRGWGEGIGCGLGLKYKDAGKTKHSGTERNRTRSNCCTIWMWTPDMLRKIGVNMPGLSMYGELISRPVPAMKTGQAPSRQYRATLRTWNILAVYLESSSGCHRPIVVLNGFKVVLFAAATKMAVTTSNRVAVS